jgi:hypothetical protein
MQFACLCKCGCPHLARCHCEGGNKSEMVSRLLPISGKTQAQLLRYEKTALCEKPTGSTYHHHTTDARKIAITAPASVLVSIPHQPLSSTTSALFFLNGLSLRQNFLFWPRLVWRSWSPRTLNGFLQPNPLDPGFYRSRSMTVTRHRARRLFSHFRTVLQRDDVYSGSSRPASANSCAYSLYYVGPTLAQVKAAAAVGANWNQNPELTACKFLKTWWPGTESVPPTAVDPA